jgi:F-type H+-transporting ATPase subunit gamma
VLLQSLRQIKSRIKSVENIWKVTRAMEMISVSKLRRVQEVLFAARAYFNKMDTLLSDLLSSEGADFSHPFFEKRVPVRKIAICVVTSDSGLCGMYNDRLLRVASDFIERTGREKIKLITVGRKGFIYFKRKGLSIERAFLGLHGRIADDILTKLSGALRESFLNKEVDEVYCIYTRFEATMRYRPTIGKLFPIDHVEGKRTKYILEPDYTSILGELIPFYAEKKLRLELLEAFTAEHSERTVAMRSATDNAKGLMESLILLRNKVRQASITKEVIEIISSAEALKG